MILRILFLMGICTLLQVQTEAEEIDLNLYEKSIYSPSGEDGVLSKIFQLLSPSSRFCVELGAGDGIERSCTRLLKMQRWASVLLDRRYENPTLHLYKEFITAENVNDLLQKYQVPSHFELLCIDLDYNDFHIWNGITEQYKPAVVMIGYNPHHLPPKDKVVSYRPYFCGDGLSDYYGASIEALYHLGLSKGYALIYAESSGHHLFFIREEVLKEKNLTFIHTNEVEKIYRPPSDRGRPQDPKGRSYNSSTDFIR